MDFVSRVLCLLIGYFCGCVLTADIVAQRMAHKRVFDLGDGNPGMANVGHCLGTRAAAYTLAGDLVKVIVATLIAGLLFPGLGSAATAWAGLGATLGHNYPFWHNFKGGKGVATTCATIVLASPIWGGISCILGLVAVIASEYLCVGAVAIPAAFVVFMLAFGTPDLVIVSLLLLLLMLPQHLPAIRDIKTGRTPRAGIAKKVREHGSRLHSEALDATHTATWAAQRGMQMAGAGASSMRQHEWRNASPLDTRLPTFDESSQSEWSVPPAQTFPTKPTFRARATTPTADSTRAASVHHTNPAAKQRDKQPARPAVISPGSTAPMVIPKVASPLDESNPLQQALMQARKHQEELRQREQEEKRRALEQRLAKEAEAAQQAEATRRAAAVEQAEAAGRTNINERGQAGTKSNFSADAKAQSNSPASPKAEHPTPWDRVASAAKKQASRAADLGNRAMRPLRGNGHNMQFGQ